MNMIKDEFQEKHQKVCFIKPAAGNSASLV